MATASRRGASRRKRGQATSGWWGEGPPPHERWPGVTIEIPAVWSKARNRWESPDGRYYFDVDAANKACDFFPEFLTHHIGEFAGDTFELLHYQRDLVVRPLFGWKKSSDGLRRFRFLFLFVPKGNGKSPLAAGLGLYLTLCDDEPAAEVYAVAGDKDQGKVVHDSAKIMVEDSADLAELCQVLKDSIYHPRSRSFFKVFSAEASSKHGWRPHGIIVDELHNQPNRKLFEALRKSMMKRRQPLLLMLSHAGDDDESICYEEYEYAKRLLSGTAEDSDETYLPVVFETTNEEDWTEPRMWRKSNPGFGLTIKEEIYASECRAAQLEPRKRNDFLMYNQNRWVNSAVSWIPIEWWDGCDLAIPADEVLARLPVCAGLDMAQKIDLVAFVLTFLEQLPGKADELEIVEGDKGEEPTKRSLSLNFRITALPFFWLPEETLREREKESRVPFTQWKEAGLLTVTEGASIDYDRVYKDITLRIAPRFPLLKQGQIGYDPAFATDIANRLRDTAGFTTAEVLQNYKHISEPSQIFEALVKSRRLIHGGHRLLRWNAENVAVKRDDAGRIRPVKPKRRAKNVDGIVGTIMGISRVVAQPETKPSALERHGVRELPT